VGERRANFIPANTTESKWSARRDAVREQNRFMIAEVWVDSGPVTAVPGGFQNIRRIELGNTGLRARVFVSRQSNGSCRCVSRLAGRCKVDVEQELIHLICPHAGALIELEEIFHRTGRRRRSGPHQLTGRIVGKLMLPWKQIAFGPDCPATYWSGPKAQAAKP